MFIDNIKYTLTTLVVAIFSLTFVASCGSADSADSSEADSFLVGQTDEFQFLARTVAYDYCMEQFELCSVSFLANGERNLESSKDLAQSNLRFLSTGYMNHHQNKSFWENMMQTEPRQRYEILVERWDDEMPSDQQVLWSVVYNLTLYQLEKAALIAELEALSENFGLPVPPDSEGFLNSGWVRNSLSPYLHIQIERLRSKSRTPITLADLQEIL